jgi:hypothetical protein
VHGRRRQEVGCLDRPPGPPERTRQIVQDGKADAGHIVPFQLTDRGLGDSGQLRQVNLRQSGPAAFTA